ncbi:hypothetical protein D0Z06_20730 [Geodermatophilus marinus]|nr:hypothetical protein D0Z06_20730 [Geodermatophilus sp. LHW52908]
MRPAVPPVRRPPAARPRPTAPPPCPPPPSPPASLPVSSRHAAAPSGHGPRSPGARAAARHPRGRRSDTTPSWTGAGESRRVRPGRRRRPAPRAPAGGPRGPPGR